MEKRGGSKNVAIHVWFEQAEKDDWFFSEALVVSCSHHCCPFSNDAPSGAVDGWSEWVMVWLVEKLVSLFNKIWGLW